MADKDFRVKNKLVVKGITTAGPLVSDASGNVDSTTNIVTQYGGTGTTTSPTSGQVLYSPSGTTYTPTTFTTLPGVYARGNTASRPASPTVGDLYYNTELNYFEVYTANGWFPIAAAPLAPTGVTATNTPSGRAYNDGRMTVAFSSNTSGGAPTSFIVTPSPTTSPSTFTGSTSPITVTGLASSTQYTYTVQATSPYGTSSASSASTGVTATTVPQAPTINSATGGPQSASVAFTAGATGGSAITSYTVTSSPGNFTASGATSPITVTGLTDGTAYTFTMTATNDNGTSLASSASSSVTPNSWEPQGAYDALAAVTLSTTTSSVTFNGIPSGYKHLQVRIFSITNTASSGASLKFNGDTSSTYYSHAVYGSGGATAVASYNNTTNIFAPNFNGGGATTGPGAAIIDILDYSSSTKLKTVLSLDGYDANGSGYIALTSGLYGNTNPITSMTFNLTSYLLGTKFALYGVK